MTAREDGALVEVQPPKRGSSKPPTYSADRLSLISVQLGNGNWLTDNKAYSTRSKAYHQADKLFHALGEPRLRRRTWADGSGGYHWAIKRVEK